MARRGFETVPVRYDTPKPNRIAHGSFGLLHQTWAITDHGVTIARRWWPIALALLIPVGGWIAWRARAEIGDPVDAFVGVVAGLAVLMVGIVGVAATPLHPPGAVTCTREGIRFGRRWADADQIDRVVIEQVVHAGRYKQRRSWVLAIRRKGQPEWRLPLAHKGDGTPLGLGRVADAMRGLLGLEGFDDQTNTAVAVRSPSSAS